MALKQRLALSYLRVLRARESLETFLDLLGVVWGVAVFAFPAFFQVGYNLPLFALTDGNAHHLGLVVATTGLIGLLSLFFHADLARHLRAYSSLAAALFWGVITVYFATRTPPISSAAAVYGLISAAEVWVYVRVSGYFDSR